MVRMDYPGEFEVSVTYELTEENAVRIVYFGVSDKTTVANMHKPFLLQPEWRGKRNCDGSVSYHPCTGIYSCS